LTQVWNDQDDNLLKRCYPTHTKNELISLFPNRTYQAIQRRASDLQVRRTVSYHHTPEAKAKMSIDRLGRKLSKQHRQALRRCTLNECAFDTLNEHSKYWIGFLISDGNVCYKQGGDIPTIALHSKEMDLQHILKFKEFLCSSHKIGRYANKRWGNVSHSISFRSEKIANALAKYGCVSRKCFKVKIKGGLEYDRDLWRGIIDGDGCLGVHERKDSGRRVPYISLTGTKTVCFQFRDFLEKKLGESMPSNVIFYKRSYLFMVSDHRAVKAIKLLYRNCTIALERKLQRANAILEEFRDRVKYRYDKPA
jgi:hypothetical protein